MPDPVNRGQPQVFQPGTHTSAFEVVFDGQSTAWNLTGQSVSASSSSPQCPAVLRVDKRLEPEDDPGQFQLHIDAAVQLRGANTRQANSTGDQQVTPGQHTVSETAIPPTTLDAYDSSIVCRTGGGGGDVVAQGPGTSLSVTVRAGEHVACVILNKRKGGPSPGPAQT